MSAGQIKLSCFVRPPPMIRQRVCLTSPEKSWATQFNYNQKKKKSVNITLFHPFMYVDKKTMC